MPATLDPRTETYRDVEKLIYSTVNRFQRRYGGDWDELVGEANLIYAEQYAGWRPGGQPFHTALGYNVWYGLFENYRRRTHGRMKVRPQFVGGEAAAELPARPGPKFGLADFLGGLSPDGAAVARLALEPPPELAVTAENKGGHTHNWRSSIRAYLADLGWGVERIRESFGEIAKVLSE